jgi:ppGpp synthetase/RelA/SpoT-type nucleotidyltranferase
MSDYEEARKRWISHRPAFQEFGREAERRLAVALKKRGMWAKVDSRAKEIDSLIRKLITKPKYSYDTLGDKLGIRIILKYKDEISDALDAARTVLELGEIEDKVDTIPPHQMGYLSTHVDVRLYRHDPLAEKFPPEVFRAELQVRSEAQHLWAEMAHDSIYKNDETMKPLPNAIKRRVFNLAGAIELADNEFARLKDDMPKTPECDLLRALERHYYKFTTRCWDPEISKHVIGFLLPLYGAEVSHIEARLEEFCFQHSTTLAHVYDESAADPADQSAFLHQPEAIMIYNLLETDRASTREVWSAHFPDKELERLALNFGISFDN